MSRLVAGFDRQRQRPEVLVVDQAIVGHELSDLGDRVEGVAALLVLHHLGNGRGHNHTLIPRNEKRSELAIQTLKVWVMDYQFTRLVPSKRVLLPSSMNVMSLRNTPT